MTKRKMITERVKLDLYDFDGSLENVRNIIDGLIKEYGASAMLDHDYDHEPYSGCGGWGCSGDRVYYFEVRYEREETDAEMEKRLATARKRRESLRANKAKKAAAKEEAERKELARLKEKYGEG